MCLRRSNGAASPTPSYLQRARAAVEAATVQLLTAGGWRLTAAARTRGGIRSNALAAVSSDLTDLLRHAENSTPQNFKIQWIARLIRWGRVDTGERGSLGLTPGVDSLHAQPVRKAALYLLAKRSLAMASRNKHVQVRLTQLRSAWCKAAT